MSLTGYEAVEVGLDGLELVDVVLPLLVRDPPWVVVCAGLTLDLIGGRCRGHRPHRCAFLQTSRKEWSQTIYIYMHIHTHTMIKTRSWKANPYTAFINAWMVG